MNMHNSKPPGISNVSYSHCQSSVAGCSARVMTCREDCIERKVVMHAGLGISNLAGAAFCAYPSTGSFARSAVQSTSGAKTGMLALPLLR